MNEEREQVREALRRDEKRTQVEKYGTPEERGCSHAEGQYEAYLVRAAICEAFSRQARREGTKVPVQNQGCTAPKP